MTGSRQYLDGRSRGWAARLNSRGERLWEKQWSVTGSLAEGFTDVATADASSIYVVGSARPNQETSRTVTAAIVLRIDAQGELIWSKSLVLGTDAHAQAVAASRDGTIIVAGSTRNRTGAKAPFISALSRDGHLSWERTLASSPDVSDIRLMPARSSGYLLSGSFGVVRLDEYGTVRWQSVPRDTFATIETTDGSIVTLSGGSDGPSKGVELTKFNSRGNQVMQTALADICWIAGAWTWRADEIFIAERRCDDSHTTWISRLSRTGKRESSERLNIPAHASALEVKPDGQDAVVAAGMFSQNSSDARKGWLFHSARLEFKN